MKRLLLFFILTTTLAFAGLEGTGRGRSELEAKNNALSDLSSRIQVEVKSEFNSRSNDSNRGYTFEDDSNINLKTANDLLGVEVEIEKISVFKDEYKATATLSSDKIFLYDSRIEEIDERIATNFKLANSGSRSEKMVYLEKILEDFKLREKYSYIITALGGEVPKPRVSRYSVERRKSSLKKELEKSSRVALNVLGDVDEKNRLYLQKELSSSIKDKRMILSYVEDGEEDYYIDVHITENSEEVIPETYIMPEMTDIRISAFMEIINSDGETIFSQNISGEGEGIERKQAMGSAIDMLKKNFNENLKVILGE